MDSEAQASPRVNSARLGDFVGRSVRLVCKVERVKDNSAIVRATDLGQVEVKMPAGNQTQGQTYIEVIGIVEDANAIKMQGCIGLGDDLDTTLVNDCINMTHDPRFKDIF